MKQTKKAILASLIGNSIFGFSFLFSKVALGIVSPFVLLSIRFLTAFLVLNLPCLTGKCKISLRGKPVGLLLLLGLVQPVCYFICETYGISMTSASFSGVMIGLAPVVGLIFGMLFLKEKCTLLQGVCTILSAIGVGMTTTGGFGASLGGFLMLLGAVCSAALFAILSRRIAGLFSAFERTYVMFALGSTVFTSIALAQNGWNPSALLAPLTQPTFVIAVLYLAVVSSVCAFLLINYALSHIPAGRALIFSNFTTVISVLAGIFIMKDAFTPMQLLGMAIITASVFGVSVQKEE
ncbi:MAG: DMT family transporter [Clostridia bacterium]|nr:DMT family transporter [Clostridia bacterium]